MTAAKSRRSIVARTVQTRGRVKRPIVAVALAATAACGHRHRAPAPLDPRLTLAIVVPRGAGQLGEVHASAVPMPADLDRDELRARLEKLGVHDLGELEETDDGWTAPPRDGHDHTLVYRTVGDRGVACFATGDQSTPLELALAECRGIRRDGDDFLVPFAPSRSMTGVFIDRIPMHALLIEPADLAPPDDPDAQPIDHGPTWTLTLAQPPGDIGLDAYTARARVTVGGRDLVCTAHATDEQEARWALSRCQTLRIP